MNIITRLPHSNTTECVATSFRCDDAMNAMAQSSEMNRLLTAAVVSRRFCRLLLTNPLAAITVGYRGEAFRLSAGEVNRLRKINATSLSDLAFQLLMEVETTRDHEQGHPHTQMVVLSPLM